MKERLTVDEYSESFAFAIEQINRERAKQTWRDVTLARMNWAAHHGEGSLDRYLMPEHRAGPVEAPKPLTKEQQRQRAAEYAAELAKKKAQASATNTTKNK